MFELKKLCVWRSVHSREILGGYFLIPSSGKIAINPGKDAHVNAATCVKHRIHHTTYHHSADPMTGNPHPPVDGTLLSSDLDNSEVQPSRVEEARHYAANTVFKNKL